MIPCLIKFFKMALTHRTLLEEWRRRSRQGQLEARRVIAEMLTPSGKSEKYLIYVYYIRLYLIQSCSSFFIRSPRKRLLLIPEQISDAL